MPDWNRDEAQIRARDASFEAPRAIARTTPAEYRVLAAEGGLLLRVMMAVLAPPFRRRERRVFGA